MFVSSCGLLCALAASNQSYLSKLLFLVSGGKQQINRAPPCRPQAYSADMRPVGFVCLAIEIAKRVARAHHRASDELARLCFTPSHKRGRHKSGTHTHTHKNMCKGGDSLTCGHVQPRTATYGHVQPCTAMCSHVQPYNSDIVSLQLHKLHFRRLRWRPPRTRRAAIEQRCISGDQRLTTEMCTISVSRATTRKNHRCFLDGWWCITSIRASP